AEGATSVNERDWWYAIAACARDGRGRDSAACFAVRRESSTDEDTNLRTASTGARPYSVRASARSASAAAKAACAALAARRASAGSGSASRVPAATPDRQGVVEGERRGAES